MPDKLRKIVTYEVDFADMPSDLDDEISGYVDDIGYDHVVHVPEGLLPTALADEHFTTRTGERYEIKTEHGSIIAVVPVKPTVRDTAQALIEADDRALPADALTKEVRDLLKRVASSEE
jgi:hypothetical protein